MCSVDEARDNGNCADHGDLLEHFTWPNPCAFDQHTLHIFGSVLMLPRKIRDWRRQGRSDRNHDRALAVWAPYFAFSICRGKMLTANMTPESNLHRFELQNAVFLWRLRFPSFLFLDSTDTYKNNISDCAIAA